MPKPEPALIANRIKTPDGTILQSYNRHDAKAHVDANGETYFVDGGLDYLRRSAGHIVRYEELSVYEDDPHDMIREAVHWGTRGIDGKESLRYVALKDMTSDHIRACLDTQPLMLPQFRVAMQNELSYRKHNE